MKKRLPNIISIARLLCVPALAWLAYRQLQPWFNVLLVAALASDVVDGWLARRWGVASEFEARLDSIADILLMAAVLFAIWALHPQVYADYGALFLAVITLIVVV